MNLLVRDFFTRSSCLCLLPGQNNRSNLMRWSLTADSQGHAMACPYRADRRSTLQWDATLAPGQRAGIHAIFARDCQIAR